MWEPNLSWVTLHLGVGGSFPLERARELVAHFDLRAVVDLRVEACDDIVELSQRGLEFLHLPTQDHLGVSQAMLDDGVTFVNRHLERGERVLVHCEHGIGRSATLALCVLVSQGSAPLEALELAKSQRPLLSPSPAQYEAWSEWLRRWRMRNRAPWSIPDFDHFKAIAYRHLSGAA